MLKKKMTVFAVLFAMAITLVAQPIAAIEEETDDENTVEILEEQEEQEEQISIENNNEEAIEEEEVEQEEAVPYATKTTEFFVSASGDNSTGDGTRQYPYASIAKAYEEITDSGTITLLSDIESSYTLRVGNKNITLQSDGNNKFSIKRSSEFENIRDNARGWYRPALIELAGSTSFNSKLTINNIILDDDNQDYKKTYKSQVIHNSDSTENTEIIHDSMIAQYNPSSTLVLNNTDLINASGWTTLMLQQGTFVMNSGLIQGGPNQKTSTIARITNNATFGSGVMIKGFKNGNGLLATSVNANLTFGGTIDGNSFNNVGHAIQMGDKATGKLTSTGKVTNNTKSTAGMLYLQAGSFVIDGEISGNTNGVDNAGALYIVNNEIVTIEKNAKITNNKTAKGTVVNPKSAGAGMYISQGSTVTMNGGLIADNVSNSGLAALANDDKGAMGGGGIAVVRNSAFIMNGGTITGNKCSTYGGGIMLHVDRAGEVKGKVILNGGTITGNTAGKAERGNDIGITSYNGTGYFATEVGQYVTIGKDMIIGDGLGNGKNQFYLNGSDVSLGQATTTANDALDTYITNKGYTAINDTLTWASVDSASETIQYGVKIETYDPLVTDIHAVVIEVDKATGQPVSTDIFADVLVSYSDNIAKVEVPRNNTSSTTTYAIKLMSKSHVNVAPVINAEDKELKVGDDFDPLDGVTATDFEDGNITLTSANVTHNDVDTSVAGTYSVTYTVSDSDGATTTKTIKVTVSPTLSPINRVPVISAEDKVLMVGDDFDPLDGVTATDFEDGNITLTSSNVTYNDVDTSVEGTYSVTYTVSDSDGATTTKTIKVTVEDKEQEEVVPPTSKPDDEDSSDVLGEVNNNKDSEKVLGETVKTSDENNILLPSIMLGVSLMIVVGFVLRKKAKRNG